MSQHQIADLFGVFVSAVGSNIRAILKSEALDEWEVSRNHIYKNGDTITLYNLEMITALAFRMRSPQASVFRKWIMKPHDTTMVLWNLPDVNSFLPN